LFVCLLLKRKRKRKKKYFWEVNASGVAMQQNKEAKAFFVCRKGVGAFPFQPGGVKLSQRQ